LAASLLPTSSDVKNDVRVSSWAELNEEIFRDSWQETLARFRSTFAFRGVGSIDDDLRTTLKRGEYVDQENHLLRNFRKYASREATAGGDSVWNWLALAQHHGLPTRLLDFTYSPFVALHFATMNVDRHGEDGAIWCIDYTATNDLLPKRLRKLLEEEGSNVFTAEMLSCAAGSLKAFDELGHDEFVAFFEPPSLDQRIINQFALFALLSSPTIDLSEWLERHPHCYRRIVIPAELKWEFRDKLDQANVTERVLFPGLDGLSSWLKRYYAPIGNQKSENRNQKRRPSSIRIPNAEDSQISPSTRAATESSLATGSNRATKPRRTVARGKRTGGARRPGKATPSNAHRPRRGGAR
jgi:hypothetical protein